MKYLVDTCTFLWYLTDDKNLSKDARRTLRAPDSDVYLSTVSCWEIAVKYALGKLPLPEPPWVYVPRQREAHGLASCELDEASALNVGKLPDYHRDPFDRMLIAQAIVQGMVLVTPDPVIARYPVPCLW